MAGARLERNALGVHLDTRGLGVTLLCVVDADAVDESLSALGLADVLNADVDTLRQNAGVDALVHNHTDGMLGHIEDSASLSVIKLVWQTSLDRTISNNINIVSLSVVGKPNLQQD